MVLVIKPTAVGIWVDSSVGRAMAKQGTGSVHSPITYLVVSPEGQWFESTSAHE